MTTITLHNNFHTSTANIRVPAADAATGRVTITAKQAKRAADKLVGIRGCTGGTVRGGEWCREYEAPDGSWVLVRN